jgi:hypothetical protein
MICRMIQCNVSTCKNPCTWHWKFNARVVTSYKLHPHVYRKLYLRYSIPDFKGKHTNHSTIDFTTHYTCSLNTITIIFSSCPVFVSLFPPRSYYNRPLYTYNYNRIYTEEKYDWLTDCCLWSSEQYFCYKGQVSSISAIKVKWTLFQI